MLYFSQWKITLITAAVLVAVFFAAPNLFSKSQTEGFPSWIPSSQMNLGLDLQGGSHILMQVDQPSLVKEKIDALRDNLRSSLRTARVRYRLAETSENAVDVKIGEGSTVEEAKTATLDLVQLVAGGLFGQQAIQEVEMSEPEDKVLRFLLTDEGLDHALSSAVTQSIEVIKRRINELGTNEPIVQRQGTDRILIQFPGLDDPQRLKALIGQTAKLTFHLVADGSAQGALEGRAPPGTKVLFEDTDPPTPVLVQSRAMIDGENLTDSQASFDQRSNEPIVTFRFDTKGGTRFCQVTSQNVNRPFAIVLDETVISAPVINEPICGGSGQISGNFSVEGANDLSVLLRAGALPAKLTVIEERTVGPGLGKDSIAAGKIAAVIGAVLVLVFMVLAYGSLGVIANVALIANIAMIVALLSVIGATLTLPGIAGIVLTMGMAVDANVLIYERIREERRNGRNMIQSFDSGFKQALATIIDANITTFIAAAILFYLGSGPIRGFSVTLAIGIITTVFTAFTFTRMLVALWVKYRRPTELARPLFNLIPENTKIKFMKDRVFSFPASALTILFSIGLFLFIGLNLGIDFKGGTLMEVQSKEVVSDSQENIEDIRTKLSDLNLGDIQVQEFGTPTDYLVRIESQGEGDNSEQSAQELVQSVLEEAYDIRRVEVVGPTISSELARAGSIAVIVALLAIMGYIWVRFEWQFALGAVIATAHDVIITIGMFALFQVEFTLASIAAILTIVGYSLNDTVVVYDRIRENLRKYKKKAIPELLDESINQMLSRTILTSVTTLLALFALYFFGGAVLASFTFAMIFGIFVGTYSSIFIAAPLLILFKLRPGQIAGAKSEIDKEKEKTANTMPVQFE